jgi:hypothetical protein
MCRRVSSFTALIPEFQKPRKDDRIVYADATYVLYAI